MKRISPLKRTRSKYFIHPGSIPQHILNILNKHPPGLCVIRLDFHSGLQTISPGRERVIRRILSSVWKYLGQIKQVMYPPFGCLDYVVLAFITSEQAQTALNTLNDHNSLHQLIDRVLEEYKHSDDADMVMRVLEEFLVGGAGAGDCARHLAQWDDTDVWLLSFQAESIEM